MDSITKELALKYRPLIFKNEKEPFPVRLIGCTVFRERERSESFPKWVVDPAAENVEFVIEYAVYYDYDIQHLYDLEHIWVGVGWDGAVKDCWCSFHGMRLRAAGVPSFKVQNGHPVLCAQPGKHAMLPSPELFGLHPEFERACSELSGGGLLIPSMLEGKLHTDADLDGRITQYIHRNFSFVPSHTYVEEQIGDDQFVSWDELLEKIPENRRESLRGVLAQDPRPHYHDDPERVYGFGFGGMEVKFTVAGKVLTVREVL